MNKLILLFSLLNNFKLSYGFNKIFLNNYYNIKNNIINLLNNDPILMQNCKINYECRIKNFQKIKYKIFEKKKFPNDIFGLRIIYTLNDNLTNDNLIKHEYAYYIKDLIQNNYLTLDLFYNDYIQTPKINNYQSIHIYVINQLLIEIQIRDNFMHYNAINGSASNYF